MACPKQLLVGLTIVASEVATLTTSSEVSYKVDKPELLTITQDGSSYTLTPVGPLGEVIAKLGPNTYKVEIVSGSTQSIKIGVVNNG